MNDVINRANLPSVLNGVTMSECDKVIEPFLEERSCDEVWHTVRALRDFYDWVMSENAVEPCKDAVSREWMLNELEEMNVANFYEANFHSNEMYGQMKRMIKAAPSVTVEPKYGEWIEKESNHVEKIYVCSNCNNYEAWGEPEKSPYCPNCGAKMTDKDINVSNKLPMSAKHEAE